MYKFIWAILVVAILLIGCRKSSSSGGGGSGGTEKQLLEVQKKIIEEKQRQLSEEKERNGRYVKYLCILSGTCVLFLIVGVWLGSKTTTDNKQDYYE